jgi:hypothetical protein
LKFVSNLKKIPSADRVGITRHFAVVRFERPLQQRQQQVRLAHSRPHVSSPIFQFYFQSRLASHSVFPFFVVVVVLFRSTRRFNTAHTTLIHFQGGFSRFFMRVKGNRKPAKKREKTKKQSREYALCSRMRLKKKKRQKQHRSIFGHGGDVTGWRSIRLQLPVEISPPKWQLSKKKKNKKIFQSTSRDGSLLNMVLYGLFRSRVKHAEKKKREND